jgi:hypothetical protein
VWSQNRSRNGSFLFQQAQLKSAKQKVQKSQKRLDLTSDDAAPEGSNVGKLTPAVASKASKSKTMWTWSV